MEINITKNHFSSLNNKLRKNEHIPVVLGQYNFWQLSIHFVHKKQLSKGCIFSSNWQSFARLVFIGQFFSAFHYTWILPLFPFSRFSFYRDILEKLRTKKGDKLYTVLYIPSLKIFQTLIGKKFRTHGYFPGLRTQTPCDRRNKTANPKEATISFGQTHVHD